MAWATRTCKRCQADGGACCQRDRHHTGTLCNHCGRDERGGKYEQAPDSEARDDWSEVVATDEHHVCTARGYMRLVVWWSTRDKCWIIASEVPPELHLLIHHALPYTHFLPVYTAHRLADIINARLRGATGAP